MSAGITGVFIGITIAGLLFVSGFALLLQPREKAVNLPLTGRVRSAFGADDTLRFVRFMAGFLMVVGLSFALASLAALLNNTTTFAPVIP